MMRRLKSTQTLHTAGVTIAVLGWTLAASAGAQGGQELGLPLRLSAFAVNMSNVGTAGSNAVDINITRWTTPQEREVLLGRLVESGPKVLMKELLRLPSHGRMRIPGWQGPDPHKVALGWTLHYAWHTPNPDGGHRIVLATDRYISMWEARNNPRTMDYPFTLVEIHLGNTGEGVGKASIATKIKFDRKKDVMELENFSSEPVRLQQVKIAK